VGAVLCVAVGLLGFFHSDWLPFRRMVIDPARDVVVSGTSLLREIDLGGPAK
jgi:hypothetical protein